MRVRRLRWGWEERGGGVVGRGGLVCQAEEQGDLPGDGRVGVGHGGVAVGGGLPGEMRGVGVSLWQG